MTTSGTAYLPIPLACSWRPVSRASPYGTHSLVTSGTLSAQPTVPVPLVQACPLDKRPTRVAALGWDQGSVQGCSSPWQPVSQTQCSSKVVREAFLRAAP